VCASSLGWGVRSLLPSSGWPRPALPRGGDRPAKRGHPTFGWGSVPKSKSDIGDADLEARCRALEGCWDGILVTDVGRLAECASGFRIIGEFCDRCDGGRLVRVDGMVRCNVCTNRVGRFSRFADDSPGVKQAIDFLGSALSIVESYRRQEQYAGPRIPIGRPYWVVALHRDTQTTRVAWQGQSCPRCARGQIAYFCAPEDPEEGLVCVNPGCGFGVGVCSTARVVDGEALRKWKDVPLEDTPHPWLQRTRRILAEA